MGVKSYGRYLSREIRPTIAQTSPNDNHVWDKRQRNRGTNERVSNERVRAVRGVREEHGDYY